MSKKDDFWDIEKLVPRKNLKPMYPTRTDTSTVPIEFGESASDEVKTSLFERAVRDGDIKAAKEYSYTPKNTLITSVTIRPRLSPSRFYADFLNDAKKYLNLHGKECRAVPFPAYIPEYRSMKQAQLDFYLYFRDCARRGEKLDAPISYILLLLFEIINLPDDIPPDYGAEFMCRVWLLYRDTYVRLDSYVADWLCDYCLIHKLEMPETVLEYTDILAEASGFPEFYLDPIKTDRYKLLCKIARHTPNAEGKYPETEVYLREHLVNVADRLACARRGTAFSPDELLTLTTGARTAYRSALCAYNNNALISYTYRSFSKFTLSAQKLADCVKYAENRIRAFLSIRARLKCPLLPDADKAIIDEYFDEALPIEKKKYYRSEYRAYTGENEHLYEPESTGVSLEAALEIEKESWKAAEMLESAFGGITDTEAVTDTKQEAVFLADTADASQDTAPITAENAESSGLGVIEIAFLRYVADGDIRGLRKFVKENRLIADAVAEKINVYAYDAIGDSVIEGADGEYTIIPDYVQEVEQWLLN